MDRDKLWVEFFILNEAQSQKMVNAFIHKVQPAMRERIVKYRILSSKWNAQLDSLKSKIKAFKPGTSDYIKLDNDIKLLHAAKARDLAPLEKSIGMIKNRVQSVMTTHF